MSRPSRATFYSWVAYAAIVFLLMFVACALASQASAQAGLSLREYVDARFEQQQKLDEESDRRYAQRFEAQQQALNAALAAAKEAVANALQASKEAVLKAEDAANKRFDSVNEFRQTLTDQAQTFMSKAEADARLKAVEDDISKISSRSEGANNLWLIIGGLIVIGFAAANFAVNFKRKERP